MNFTVAYWMCKTCRCYTNADILLLKKTGREENFSWQVLGCLTSIVGLVLGVLITFGILRLIQIRYPIFIPFNWRPGDTSLTWLTHLNLATLTSVFIMW